MTICYQFSWLRFVTDSFPSLLKVFSIKLGQQSIELFLLPFLGAMLAENLDLRSSLLTLGKAQTSLALLLLKRSLVRPARSPVALALRRERHGSGGHRGSVAQRESVGAGFALEIGLKIMVKNYVKN